MKDDAMMAAKFQQIKTVAFGQVPWFDATAFLCFAVFNLWRGETLGVAVSYSTLLIAWMRLTARFKRLNLLAWGLLAIAFLGSLREIDASQVTWQEGLGAVGAAVTFVLPLCAIMLWLDRVLKPWSKRSGQRILGALILLVVLSLFWSVYIFSTLAFFQWQPQFSPFSP